MGDVVSSHLDEAKRDIITARSRKVMDEFGRLYEQQFAVALFNNIRFDIEGGGGPQPQLLHRKYLEENKKWRNRFLFVSDSYGVSCYDSKAAHDRRLHPKGTINCAGYKVLTSMDQYLQMISNSLPDVKAKVGSSPFLKCSTQFPLILWHPYGRHHYFCTGTEEQQQKWNAVLQDCVRHTNDGLSEEDKVQTPAFTDAVRLYRQARGNYGTWEMMCGSPTQILSNLVMEDLLPELRDLISPRLKGKLYDKQRIWMLIIDAVYSLVQSQCQSRYQAVVQKCEQLRSSLATSIRTDMDQIITSKEHVTNKIRAAVLPKAEKLLKVSIQPYIGSILDALMEPTSRGFSEVRDVFFRELVDMSKNAVNQGTKETIAQHMEKISMLAFHPVKMQSCYEQVERLSLEGLQQRFDVSSPAVFVHRAQILIREQMDDAVYTFEQILHQSLESQSGDGEDLCKIIQRCQDRVIKKFDYDSSTVRKRFFREALLQIFIPYMLKQLGPACSSELPRFQELIFSDFSRFILVENIFEEVVLHSVMKDITTAVKEAAVQRRHNLYRDSIVLTNSDPNLHLLAENASIDWAGEYGGEGGAAEQEEEEQEEVDGEGGGQKRRRVKQVVSMIQVEGPAELSAEALGVGNIPEEEEEEEKTPPDVTNNSEEQQQEKKENQGRDAASGQNESTPKVSENLPDVTNCSEEVQVKEEPPTAAQEEEERKENQGQGAASATPKASENRPEVVNNSEEVQQKVEPPPATQEENPGGAVACSQNESTTPEVPENLPDVARSSEEVKVEPPTATQGREENQGGGAASDQKESTPPEVPENLPDVARSSEEVKVERPAGAQEEQEENQGGETVSASPKAPKILPDVTNNSEEEQQEEEKRLEASDSSANVETKPESAPSLQKEEMTPPSTQEEPLLPPPPEENPSGAGAPAEVNLPPAPPSFSDSGFQSPTIQEEETEVSGGGAEPKLNDSDHRQQ
ncbi:protein Niban 2-like isoform 2-T2 [Pholidichthys leucotaenia]